MFPAAPERPGDVLLFRVTCGSSVSSFLFVSSMQALHPSAASGGLRAPPRGRPAEVPRTRPGGQVPPGPDGLLRGRHRFDPVQVNGAE